MDEQYDYERKHKEFEAGSDTKFERLLLPYIRRHIQELHSKFGLGRCRLTVLDAGSGCGYLSNQIAQMGDGIKVVGVDPSEEAVNFARTKYPNIEFVRGALGVDNVQGMVGRQSDAVVANMVIHNVPDLRSFFGGVASNLKNGGRLIANTTDPRDWAKIRLERQGKDPNSFDADVDGTVLEMPFKNNGFGEHERKFKYHHHSVESLGQMAGDARLRFIDMRKDGQRGETVIRCKPEITTPAVADLPDGRRVYLLPDPPPSDLMLHAIEDYDKGKKKILQFAARHEPDGVMNKITRSFGI